MPRAREIFDMNVVMKRLLAVLLALAPATAHADRISEAPAVVAIDCTTTKTVTITNGSGRYAITGACDKVAVSGGMNTIAIAAAKNLSISGSKNEITIDKVDKIAAIGSNNRVTYGGGLTLAKPKSASVGKGNVIVAAPTPATPATPPTPSGTAALDCSANPTLSITDNNASLDVAGPCESVSVEGNNNTIRVASARTVTVTGNTNTVEIVAANRIATSGNLNTVRYQKPVSAKTVKVANTGNKNKITKTR